MSETVVIVSEEVVVRDEAHDQVRIGELAWDERRGTRSMYMFIATEAMLFVALFFSYFYLGAGQAHWPMDEPPKLGKAWIMLVTLLSSSVVLWFGEQLGKRGKALYAKLAVACTCLLGGVFLFVQTLEYKEHLKTLVPGEDAYASIFYTITSVHALHVMMGLSMLLYTLFLPHPEHTEKPPYKALHNAGMYWHFVDAVWVIIVMLLYLLPNLEQIP